MKYRIEQTVKRDKKSFRRYIAGIAASITIAAGAAAPALAASGGLGYAQQPGYDVSESNSQQCAGGSASDHGAFGYFGKDNNEAGGTDGYLTGLSTSTVCGNR
jgi:hypothetical protein